MAGMQQKWIRAYKPNGTMHVVPAANKNFYLKHNESLLMGSNPRRDLLLHIEDMTPEENEAENRRILDEGTAQSKKAKKFKDAALAASVGAQSSSATNDVLAELLRQNQELINTIKNQSDGKKTRKAEQAV